MFLKQVVRLNMLQHQSSKPLVDDACRSSGWCARKILLSTNWGLRGAPRKFLSTNWPLGRLGAQHLNTNRCAREVHSLALGGPQRLQEAQRGPKRTQASEGPSARAKRRLRGPQDAPIGPRSAPEGSSERPLGVSKRLQDTLVGSGAPWPLGGPGSRTQSGPRGSQDAQEAQGEPLEAPGGPSRPQKTTGGPRPPGGTGGGA